MALPKGEWSAKFITLMKNRCLQGFFKYGTIKANSQLTDRIRNAINRVEKYQDDGNTEWLVDASNFLMFEFMYPSHQKAHFRATEGGESPGITGTSEREFHKKFYQHEGD